jgi:hypothetical protein
MKKPRTIKRTRCHHAAFETGLTYIRIDRDALAAIARMLAAEAKADADRERLEKLAEEMQNA